MTLYTALGFLLATACATGGAVRPIFPEQWIHTAEMMVKASPGGPPPMEFVGQNVLCTTQRLAHVNWIIHAGNTTTPFKFILDGASNPTSYYQIDQNASCTVEDYPEPLFNPAWDANITHAGVGWRGGTLCDKWDNALLYFGRQVLGTLYSDQISGVVRYFECPAYTIEFRPALKAVDGGGSWVTVPDNTKECETFVPMVRKWLDTQVGAGLCPKKKQTSAGGGLFAHRGSGSAAAPDF